MRANIQVPSVSGGRPVVAERTEANDITVLVHFHTTLWHVWIVIMRIWGMFGRAFTTPNKIKFQIQTIQRAQDIDLLPIIFFFCETIYCQQSDEYKRFVLVI